MSIDFNQRVPRRGTGSIKWELFAEDVLPLWVADMDFPAPPPVVQAIQQAAEHGIFGYQLDSPPLRAVIVERLATLYNWTITPDQIVFLPGLVSGINVVCATVGDAGSGVLIQPPVYPPFHQAPPTQNRVLHTAPLVESLVDGRLVYTIDFNAFEAAITPDTRLFLLCSPHNPVGRVWTREELERLAAICLKHDLLICADEIHADLLLDERPHTPFAALAPEIAARTITLMAPSKTFNLAGLGCSFAIVPDDSLRRRMTAILFHGMVPLVNTMGFAAALAAYRDGGPWLEALRVHLRGNRDALEAFVDAHLPDLRQTHVEGTYLAWLDGRALVDGHPGLRDYLASSDPTPTPMAAKRSLYTFLHDQARVALNDGAPFGGNSEAFVRLNFACTRDVLIEALERIRAALYDAAPR